MICRSWVLGRQAALTVYGGEGVGCVVSGFNAVYAADDAYRLAHHGNELFDVSLRPAIASTISDAGINVKIVYDKDDVKVTAFDVNHEPKISALGFRIDYAGKSVVVSGDTTDTDGLRKHSGCADLLVSEVLHVDAVENLEPGNCDSRQSLIKVGRNLKHYWNAAIRRNG